MSKFLTDVRDYIYILAYYRHRSFSYWVYCLGLTFFHYLGLFVLMGLVIPDYLFLYIAKTKQYPYVIQMFNYIMFIAPASLVAMGFDYLLINHPLPSREEITPKVFRRKLLSMYFFLFTGLLFTMFCIFLLLKYKFGS